MILVIDNYDSFTYNVVDYLGKLSQQEIRIFRNDKIDIPTIENLNPSCILLSPGPKRPDDAGITLDVIAHFKGKLPILGICLGHQAIGQYFGGKIIKIKEPKHGKRSLVKHEESPLFLDIDSLFYATRYHSLVIEKSSLPKELSVLAISEDDHEIMAIKHKDYPIYGIQFHPESIYTKDGLKMIENFLIQTGVETRKIG